jgi:hypothetical protein
LKLFILDENEFTGENVVLLSFTYQLFHLYFREVEQEIAAKLQELKLMNFEDKEETMLENKI